MVAIQGFVPVCMMYASIHFFFFFSCRTGRREWPAFSSGEGRGGEEERTFESMRVDKLDNTLDIVEG